MRSTVFCRVLCASGISLLLQEERWCPGYLERKEESRAAAVKSSGLGKKNPAGRMR